MNSPLSDSLSAILDTFRLRVDIINNAQYCGEWAIDTSGRRDVSFHLVVHGHCVIQADCLDQPEHLEEGDFVLFPHDASHLLQPSLNCADIKVNTSKPVSYETGLQQDGVGLLCGYFTFAHKMNTPLMEQLSDVLIKRRRELDDGGVFASLLNLILAESLRSGVGSNAIVNRAMESLFILLMREHIANTKTAVGLAAALANPRLARALTAIHQQPEEKWTVEKLADIANLSRSAFAEQFKRYLNESPIDYLTRWRMQSAWQWLQDEKLTVFDVAQRCGYQTEAAFAKAFKRIVGVGPGAARKASDQLLS